MLSPRALALPTSAISRVSEAALAIRTRLTSTKASGAPSSLASCRAERKRQVQQRLAQAHPLAVAASGADCGLGSRGVMVASLSQAPTWGGPAASDRSLAASPRTRTHPSQAAQEESAPSAFGCSRAPPLQEEPSTDARSSSGEKRSCTVAKILRCTSSGTSAPPLSMPRFRASHFSTSMPWRTALLSPWMHQWSRTVDSMS
mmetsp:Transcript_62109/g.195994  ORF Transcript_62109/g.195994 Transcript_62109/m.195994 type:complete len:202 (-) Transcript_62109:986-1591(-)